MPFLRQCILHGAATKTTTDNRVHCFVPNAAVQFLHLCVLPLAATCTDWPLLRKSFALVAGFVGANLDMLRFHTLRDHLGAPAP